jgi:hypothetical protein
MGCAPQLMPREVLIEVLQSDYLRAALRSFRPAAGLLMHAFKPALLPADRLARSGADRGGHRLSRGRADFSAFRASAVIFVQAH